jgi:solute carrier family 45, member 1/2/4
MFSRDLFFVSLALLGVQILWTVEFGYGTPYLLSMGFTKAQSTLVWVAGPVSGLIIQPLIGRLSDRQRIKLINLRGWERRKPYLMIFSVVTVVSILMIAFPDMMMIRSDSGLKIIIAVGFYLFDAGMNGVQAMSRALIVDCIPRNRQQQAHASAAWMIALGSRFLSMINFCRKCNWILNWCD